MGSGDGLLEVDLVSGSFHIEYQACNGYEYVEEFTPEDFQIDPTASELEASEETIIGYKDPSVNDGDDEREAACEAAFNARFPDEEWVEKEIAVEEDEAEDDDV